MKDKNMKKIILNFLIIFFLIGTCFCLFKARDKDLEFTKENEMLGEFALESSEVNASNLQENKLSQMSDTNELSLLDSYRKKYNNDEVAAVLSIDNTKINTVLMQTTNNDYYVRRLPNKKRHVTGSVFIDYRTKLNQDKNVIIYGHNANNYDIPFRYLRNYLNENYYLKHKYIDIQTDTSKDHYEIFSVYTTNDDYFHTKTDFLSDDKWLNHLNKLKEKSIYGTNISLSANDSIITLQTCLLKDDALIIISAKKI